MREYIGDGVYVEYDGHHIWLIVSDGYADKRIALEYPVYINFISFASKVGFKIPSHLTKP